uniref:cytochrome-b5 reductase n=1 Tax=Aegilops tauschii subsp. strangulata TaxID=200361 RepID=A0A452ZDM3_AEGTS
MEFLQGQSTETTVAVAVAVVAVAAGAGFLLLRSKKPKGCLDAENFKEFKLVQKRQISHNVAKFKFALPTPTSVLGLPIGQHISCRGQDATGEEVIKPYTPTTLDSDIGYFELVIKVTCCKHVPFVFFRIILSHYLYLKYQSIPLWVYSVVNSPLVFLLHFSFSLYRCIPKEECLIIFVR